MRLIPSDLRFGSFQFIEASNRIGGRCLLRILGPPYTTISIKLRYPLSRKPVFQTHDTDEAVLTTVRPRVMRHVCDTGFASPES